MLLVVSYNSLFFGTIIGFLASAMLVASVVLPRARAIERRSFFNRTTRGLKAYLATPRLRGLLAISLSVSAAGAMIIVNTVVLVSLMSIIYGSPVNAAARVQRQMIIPRCGAWI